MSMIKCCSKFRKLLALVRILKWMTKWMGFLILEHLEITSSPRWSNAICFRPPSRIISSLDFFHNHIFHKTITFLLLRKLTDTSQGLYITRVTVKAKDHLVINQSLTTYLQLVNVQIFTKKIIRKKYLTFLW